MPRHSKLRGMTREEREDRKARREAKLHGYEYRPGALDGADVARRLEAGFEMMEDDERVEDDE